MVCISRAVDGRLSPGAASTVLLALFSWCTSHLRTLDQAETVSLGGRQGPLPTLVPDTTQAHAASLDAAQGQCEAGLSEDWTLRCGMELNIFTEMRPADLLALIALIRRANEVARELDCRPEEYPIKEMFAGGGRNVDLRLREFRSFLADLQFEGLLPGPRWFNVTAQTHPGPAAPDAHLPLYIARYRFTTTLTIMTGQDPNQPVPGETTLRSAEKTIRATMEPLNRQRAPVIVALRPIYEFALLWSVYSLYQAPRTFEPTDEYRAIVRRAAPGDWLLDPQNVQASILTFKRSRLAMYDGDDHFARMGLFFATQIQNSSATNTTDAAENVRRLEETFVDWPQQVVLVDLDGVLSETPQPRPMFDALVQPEFFRFVAEQGVRQFARAKELIGAWNTPAKVVLRGRIAQYLEAFAPRLRDPGEFAHLEQIADALDLAGPSDPNFRAAQRNFRRRAEGLGDWMSGAMAAMYRGTGQGKCAPVTDKRARPSPSRLCRASYPWLVDQPRTVVRQWAHLASMESSFVEANNLLVPFVFERDGGLVRESLRRVTYQGQDQGTGRYVWPEAAQYSASSVWFSNASSSLPDATSSVEDREVRLQRELGALYMKAFTPLPLA
ncbi:MAG: hypothetical protein M1832_000629 [Thelocarpon impressellum]|nr:MAG: hypothetical protein M1832_000629 [Thelocarpon impressellum]